MALGRFRLIVPLPGIRRKLPLHGPNTVKHETSSFNPAGEAASLRQACQSFRSSRPQGRQHNPVGHDGGSGRQKNGAGQVQAPDRAERSVLRVLSRECGFEP
jgi:hypothetical protein